MRHRRNFYFHNDGSECRLSLEVLPDTLCRTEKQRRFWDVPPQFLALSAALIMSGVCALLVPKLAGLAFVAALALSIASYMGQILFTWLTEELGEG